MSKISEAEIKELDQIALHVICALVPGRGMNDEVIEEAYGFAGKIMLKRQEIRTRVGDMQPDHGTLDGGRF
jgi:hypothetical protein